MCKTLENIEPQLLEQRAYLYYGTYAEYFQQIGKKKQAISYLDEALDLVKNEGERKYLLEKRELMRTS